MNWRRIIPGFFFAVLAAGAGGYLLNSSAITFASNANITGTVFTLDGRGVWNARVVMSCAGGPERFAQTNPAGRFQFPDVVTGQSCTFTVTHKVFSFDAQLVNLTGAADLLFTVKPTQTNFALDPSFGNGGRVTTDFGGNDRALSVMGQPDGKIVVVGSTNNQAAIARYNSDGTLDASFGSGGKVISPTLLMAVDLNIKPGALQPDGKIVIAGRNAINDFMIERRDVNGALDPGFGSGGVVTFEFGNGSADLAKAVAVQSDGKIVVAGTTNFGTMNAGIGIVRFSANGVVDAGFGRSGRTIVDSASVDDPRIVAFQTDGKTLIAGVVGSSRPNLVRLNTDGSIDTAFGINGVVAFTHNGGGYDLSLQRDGKIVVIGEGLSRVGANGIPDAAFNGPSGAMSVPSTELQSVALRADGMILAGGRAFIGSSDGDFGLALIHPYTALVVTHFETDILNHRFDDPKDMLVQPDGRIVVVGYTVPVSTSDFALVRYVNF